MDRKECINCEKARVVRLGRFPCSSTCNGLKVRAPFFFCSCSNRHLFIDLVLQHHLGISLFLLKQATNKEM